MAARKRKPWRWSGLVVREVVGWALLLYGLSMFRHSLRFLEQARVVEGFVSAIVGVMLFRGALQLIKVAVAARAFRNEPSAPDSVAGRL